MGFSGAFGTGTRNTYHIRENYRLRPLGSQVANAGARDLTGGEFAHNLEQGKGMEMFTAFY